MSRRRLVAATSVFWLLVAGIVAGQPASAEEFCPHNAIVCENQNNTGVDDTEWDDIHGAGDSDIQGFTTDISVNRGGTVEFKVSTVAASYRIDIYRIGWYGGKGARKMHTLEPDPALAQDQDDCVTDPTPRSTTAAPGASRRPGRCRRPPCPGCTWRNWYAPTASPATAT